METIDCFGTRICVGNCNLSKIIKDLVERKYQTDRWYGSDVLLRVETEVLAAQLSTMSNGAAAMNVIEGLINKYMGGNGLPAPMLSVAARITGEVKPW